MIKEYTFSSEKMLNMRTFSLFTQKYVLVKEEKKSE